MRTTILLLLSLCLVAGPGLAATWHVEQDGSGDFDDIQPAVDAAAEGDTIRIGPGRFDTFNPFTAPAWTEQVIVGVRTDDLTFIGSGPELTIVGTETVGDQPEGTPKCFCSIDSLNAVIKNMTIENVDQGIYWWRGNLEVGNCLLRRGSGAYYAIGVWVDSLVVENCDFEFDWLGYGIIAFSSTESVIVQDCRFRGPGTGLNTTGTPSVVVESCTFDQSRAGVHLDSGSSVRIEDSTFSNIAVSAVLATGISNVDLNSVLVENCLRGIDVVTRSNAVGSFVVVKGSTSVGILLQSGSTISLNNSHILLADGYAVLCDSYGEETIFQDLKNCYWGSADADSIAAMIWDGNDDPAIHSIVNFEPFSDVPLPTDKKTMGGLKAMYLGGR